MYHYGLTAASLYSLAEEFENNEHLIWQDAASELIDTVCNLRAVTHSLIERVPRLKEGDKWSESKLK